MSDLPDWRTIVLKACPFCGNDAYLHTDSSYGMTRAKVVCGNEDCAVRTPMKHEYTATDVWNRRETTNGR